MWGGISLWFWFAFPWWLVTLSTFSCVCWPSYVYFGKMSIQSLCPFFNWVVFFVVVELYEFFICFAYWLHIRYIICKYLLSISRLSFCFHDGFLCCGETFWFDVVPFVVFALLYWGTFPLYPLCWEFLQYTVVKYCQIIFLHLLKW